MKEALNAIVDYLINGLNCIRISAEVMIENISSIKLLEKMDLFKKELKD